MKARKRGDLINGIHGYLLYVIKRTIFMFDKHSYMKQQFKVFDTPSFREIDVELEEYYNDQFKDIFQEEFEDLPEETISDLKKSLKYACWRLGKYGRIFKAAWVEKYFNL
jgi:hypothetical protein